MSFVVEDVRSPGRDGSKEQDLDENVRLLARNEVLFEAGDLKTNLYRVETGAICIYAIDQSAKVDVIEFALAGDLVGMGFLERHATNARAAIDTKVRSFPLDALHTLATSDERAKARFDSAVRHEFAYRRNLLVDAGRSRPLVRLAAFLIAVSQQNAREGRDPAFIDDTLESAVVADYLGISIDLLGSELGEAGEAGIDSAYISPPLAYRGFGRTRSAGERNARDITAV